VAIALKMAANFYAVTDPYKVWPNSASLETIGCCGLKRPKDRFVLVILNFKIYPGVRVDEVDLAHNSF
jgi:hypothetical protein